MKSKIEIIEELFDNGYVKDPSTRALTYNEDGKQKGCAYLTLEGNKCAVGKCLIEDENADYWDSEEDVFFLVPLALDMSLDDILKEEYRGHDIRFWSDLQIMHDDSQRWARDGLSDYGVERLNGLKSKYRE